MVLLRAAGEIVYAPNAEGLELLRHGDVEDDTMDIYTDINDALGVSVLAFSLKMCCRLLNSVLVLGGIRSDQSDTFQVKCWLFVNASAVGL